ncbi:MAG TPA: hypothetical protein VFM01_11510 [Nakamurella sp.]|nr:hypothetical protein [Nakamurella sp.]
MGLFSRKRDAVGLYTGDAPVSAPGVDGAAPTAYDARIQPHIAAAPMVGPGPVLGSAPDIGSGPEIGTTPMVGPGPVAAGPAAQPFPGSPAPPFPGSPGQPFPGPPAAQFGGPPAQHPSAPADVAAMVAAAHQAAANPRMVRQARRSVGGCLAALIVMALAAGGVVFAVLKVNEAMDTVTGSSAQPTPTQTPARTGIVGTPITARYDGADLELTVLDVQAQPGNSWAYANPGDDPRLIVQVRIRRTDSRPDTVTVMGWDWAITPPNGRRVTGDIITEYLPEIADPELRAGDEVQGFLSFRTAATAGALTFADSMARTPQISWPVTATRPKPVAGKIGAPVQGEVSHPGFTVTVAKPRTIGASDPSVITKPRSGRYLLVDVRITPAPGVQGYLGLVDNESFAFVPSGGASVPASPAALGNASSTALVDDSDPVDLVMAFDTKAKAGTLQMKDGAGRTVITWKITST